jgi:hypothetical protein
MEQARYLFPRPGGVLGSHTPPNLRTIGRIILKLSATATFDRCNVPDVK